MKQVRDGWGEDKDLRSRIGDMQARLSRIEERVRKPRKVPYNVHDSEGTGLLLRVSPRGRKTWMVSYRSPTGIKQQRPIGKYPAMRVAAAREAALLALSDLQFAGGLRTP